VQVAVDAKLRVLLLRLGDEPYRDADRGLRLVGRKLACLTMSSMHRATPAESPLLSSMLAETSFPPGPTWATTMALPAIQGPSDSPLS
jgi:hypothetical protein